MQALTVDTPTVDHCGTIFVAIELSQKTWLVTLHSPDKGKMSRHKLEGGDHAELLALIGRERDRAGRALGAIPAVVSCLGFTTQVQHLLGCCGDGTVLWPAQP
jgi:transposase